MHTLKAGTALYHGTDADFEEDCERLDGPAWVTSSKAVATYFAKRSNVGGTRRIIEYVLTEDLTLPDIYTQREMLDFAEAHGIELDGVEEMRDSVAMSGQPGWILPHNYPDGDDILIVDTSVLEFRGTQSL